MSTPIAVRLVGVRHAYGETRVLDGVDLEAVAGEVVALAGPSGSGKSTVVHLVAGFEEPQHGLVEVLGRPPGPDPDWSRVAVVPQHHGLVEGLSVEDNVLLPALRRDPRATRPDLLEALDLEALARRRVEETSLGEQQRAAVARSLVLDPRVVVLDEPTAHQDEAHVAQVLEALRRGADGGTAVLVATHDPVVLEASDRVVALVDGRTSG